MAVAVVVPVAIATLTLQKHLVAVDQPKHHSSLRRELLIRLLSEPVALSKAQGITRCSIL
jgi:hypothetical protein